MHEYQVLIETDGEFITQTVKAMDWDITGRGHLQFYDEQMKVAFMFNERFWKRVVRIN